MAIEWISVVRPREFWAFERKKEDMEDFSLRWTLVRREIWGAFRLEVYGAAFEPPDTLRKTNGSPAFIRVFQGNILRQDLGLYILVYTNDEPSHDPYALSPY